MSLEDSIKKLGESFNRLAAAIETHNEQYERELEYITGPGDLVTIAATSETGDLASGVVAAMGDALTDSDTLDEKPASIEAPPESEKVALPTAKKKPAAKKETAAKKAAAKRSTPKPANDDNAYLTVKDVRHALIEIAKHFDAGTGTDILSRFGAKRIPELKEDQYAEVIAKCDAVLEGEPV